MTQMHVQLIRNLVFGMMATPPHYYNTMCLNIKEKKLYNSWLSASQFAVSVTLCTCDTKYYQVCSASGLVLFGPKRESTMWFWHENETYTEQQIESERYCTTYIKLSTAALFEKTRRVMARVVRDEKL
jgi:hypothetical protein